MPNTLCPQCSESARPVYLSATDSARHQGWHDHQEAWYATTMQGGGGEADAWDTWIGWVNQNGLINTVYDPRFNQEHLADIAADAADEAAR